MPKLRRLLLCVSLLCLLALSSAHAGELTALVPVLGGTLEVRATIIDDEPWFFLPSHTDMAQLTVIQPDGSRVFLSEVNDEGGIYSAVGNDVVCYLMRSENIRSVFLESSDPVNQGREYIDNSELHAASTTGSLTMVDQDGVISHKNRIRKLRGRGNGTWEWGKKPYQIKLEDRADLLDRKDADEMNRTWVLLAMATDGTYLHDRMTFDLARELGDQSASGSEHVNLYYDGEYRGLYLLCEKTEIESGRVDELDYDEIIETLFERAGRHDLEQLPAAQSANRFGNVFTCIGDLLEPEAPDAGAFLLELESTHTLSDPCWFMLSNGLTLASKNPEYASERMMTYVSERMEEALQTLVNRGVNPENGRTVSQDFDVDAFARSILLSELSGNLDSYLYSSTYFVLPAGETRFRPGPPWDFDLAYRYPERNDLTVTAAGYRERDGWIQWFLSSGEVRDAIRKLCDQLTPAVKEILLGEKQGIYLRPIDEYAAEIDAARRMNEKLWNVYRDSRLMYGDSFEEEIELFKAYLSERGEWLLDQARQWDASPEKVELWADAAYTNVETDLRIGVYPWCGMQIEDFTWEQLTDATEEEFALWQADVTLSALEGYSFESPEATINGTPAEITGEDDGTYTVSFTFEDLSYRPVDAYGEDIGLIYDYDLYTRRYPEVAEACDFDPELVLDYFLDEGMYEGHKANAFFSPPEILAVNQYVEEYLGVDWWLYYQEYLSYAYSEWVLPVDARFDLPVIP